MGEKSNKNTEIGFGGLLAIVLIVVIVTMAIIFGINYLTTRNSNNENETQSQSSNNNVSNEVKKEENIGKIDNSKEYVYQANYTNNLNVMSYGDNYAISDFVVPYININSEDATKANQEIKAIYDNFIQFVKEEIDNKTTASYQKASYKTYINDNVLSVVLTIVGGGTDAENYAYYTYNFDLTTLKLINYEDIYKKAGYTAENIEEKVSTAIKNHEAYNGMVDWDDIDTYKENSVKNYKKAVQDNTIKYYMNNRELNVVVTFEIPVGRGQFEKIVTIKD